MIKMQELKSLILNNESWLVKRILKYALEHNFTKYTSTLEEAWRLSISGLSESIAKSVDIYKDVPELDPDDAYDSDPISEFAILEALKHRERGISIEMFLALSKYYKQAYLDLILFKSVAMPQNLEKQRLFVERSFDRIEIAYTKKWSETPESNLIDELRKKNRLLANEKNKYLTVFESVSEPILLIDNKGTVTNLNHAAAKIISPESIPGGNYYSPHQIEELEDLLDINILKSAREVFIGKKMSELFPWITNHKASSYFSLTLLEGKTFYNKNNGKSYKLYSSGMLDVSQKFEDIIIGFREIEKDSETDESKDIKQYLDFLVDDANVILLGLDKDAKVIFFSRGAERITGYSKDEIINKNWFEKIVPKHKFPQVYKVFKRAIEDDINPQFFENSIITKNGEEKTIFWKNDINSDLYGEFAIFSVGIDITQFRMEQKIDQTKIFETIFDSITEAVFLVNQNGKMIYHNNNMISLITPAKLSKTHQIKSISDFDLELWIEMQRLAEKEIMLKNMTLEDFEKHRFFPAELLIQKISINNASHYLISIRDISDRKKKDRIIRESEDKFKLLYDSLAQGVILHSKDGDVLDLNTSATEIFSLDVHDTRGKKAMANNWLLYDEKGNEIDDHNYPLYQVISNKKAINNKELWVKNLSTDKNLWISVSIVPQFEEDGEIKQIWSIIEDINDRKLWETKLVNSQVQFKELFEKAPIPVLIFDIKGDLLDANEVALQWYDLTKDQLLQLNINVYSIKHLFIKKDISLDDVFIKHLTRNWFDIPYSASESKILGSDKIVNVKMYPIKNNFAEVDKIICFLEDVTSQKEAMNKLEQLNQDLENRVRERTKELESAKKEVEKSLMKKAEYSDLQSRFINMISHEYRTPLTYISTSAAVLERVIRNQDLEKSFAYISKIYAAVNILNHLVDDVVKFVEVETSELRVVKRTVNIVEYLDRLIREVKILDKSVHDVVFTSEKDYFSTMIDTNLLRQIITHIMINAMKFSPEESKIDIRLVFDKETFAIEVEDRGVGISEEDLKHIFAPFYKSKKDIGIKSGTGLGLRLVNRFIEAMKGDIEIKSVINKGTTVVLTFPSV